MASRTSQQARATRTPAASTVRPSRSAFLSPSSIAIKAKSPAPVTPLPRPRRSPAKPRNRFLLTCSTLTKICTPAIRLFSSIVVATLTRPNNRATSANTPTAAARPACSISWMQSAPIALTSLLIGRLSPITCSPLNSCARPLAQGIFHDSKFAAKSHALIQLSYLLGRDSAAGGGLRWLRRWLRGIQNDLLHRQRIQSRQRAHLSDHAGSVGPHPSRASPERKSSSHPAPHRSSCLQRF